MGLERGRISSEEKRPALGVGVIVESGVTTGLGVVVDTGSDVASVVDVDSGVGVVSGTGVDVAVDVGVGASVGVGRDVGVAVGDAVELAMTVATPLGVGCCPLLSFEVPLITGVCMSELPRVDFSFSEADGVD